MGAIKKQMIYVLYVSVFLSLPIHAQAACDTTDIATGTLISASCSIDEINLCVTAAKAGADIPYEIIVPACALHGSGELTASKTIDLSTGAQRDIAIIGAGEDVTYFSSTGAYGLTILAPLAKNFRMAGFTWDQNGATGTLITHYAGTTGLSRFDHFKMPNRTTGRGINWLGRSGGGYGVIDHGTFQTASTAVTPQQVSISGFSGGYQNEATLPISSYDSALGTANMVFVEDCTFDYSLSNSVSDTPIDVYNGGRLTLRHNSFIHCNPGTHGFEGTHAPGILFEMYNNNFDSTRTLAPAWAFGNMREGTGVIYNHVIAVGSNYARFDDWFLYRDMLFGSLGYYSPADWKSCDGRHWKICSNSGKSAVSTYWAACEQDSDCANPVIARNGSGNISYNMGTCSNYLCRNAGLGQTSFMKCDPAGTSCNTLMSGTGWTCDGTVDGAEAYDGSASGTANGGSATTLTVAGTPWTTNQYKENVTGHRYYVHNDTTGAQGLVMSNDTNSLAVNGVEFFNGISTIAVGNTVVGKTSGATGLVSLVELASGSWSASGKATGVLALTSVTGTFQKREILQVLGVDSATLDTGYGFYGGSRQAGQSGDAFTISNGYPCRGHIGRGQNNKLQPVYMWNNNFKGTIPSPTHYVPDPKVVLGRDIIDLGASPLGGYTAYTYPHPLQGSSYILTVTKAGAGSGTVTSDISGISCGATCTASYSSGQSVVLTASVGGSNTFTGWSGEGCSGTGTCTVSMSQARNVTATFGAGTPYNVIISYAGSGAGATTPAAGSVSHAQDDSVSVTQTPSNSTFTSWSGTCGCTGTGACSFTMPGSDCTVIATWTDNPKYTLTVTPPVHGEVVVSDTGGINCGGGNSICTAQYYSGTPALTTTCAQGWYGPTFGGDCTGASCAPSMTQDRTVTAHCVKPGAFLGNGVINP